MVWLMDYLANKTEARAAWLPLVTVVVCLRTICKNDAIHTAIRVYSQMVYSHTASRVRTRLAVCEHTASRV